MFCTYLDSQLPPLPQPGGRAFFNRYVVSGDKKSPKEIIAEVKNKTKCAILCTNIMKPKLNFISDGKIHNCVHVSDKKCRDGQRFRKSRKGKLRKFYSPIQLPA